MAVDFSLRMGSSFPPRLKTDAPMTGRRTNMSPDLDVEADVPSPSPNKRRRQMSNAELSPNDTPRKNKRKLSEPKRRTTDFSIKRLCPDSPGSVCSESGRSEESTPERVHEELRDSPSENIPSLNSDLKTPYVFPDMRHHPYFIPQFYYPQRFADPLAPYGTPTTGQSCLPNSSSSSRSSVGNAAHPYSNVRYSSCDDSAIHENKASHKISEDEDLRKSSRDQDSDSGDSSKDGLGKKCRKNYKNMTRERRVEANARERSRVHTISAAFDGLRRAVPSYSYNQKLSKLAILRIACSYINALTKLASADDNPSSSDKKSFGECVDHCTRTIQTEGKARRRH